MTDNVRGAALMVLSMLLYVAENAIVKGLTTVLPPWQILMMTGLGGTLLFGTITRLRGLPVVTRSLLSRAVLLRSLGEVVGAVGFFLALAFVPLSTASAILQALPLIVTMGAALILGESVGWRRWTAVCVGFAGVLLIIRPSADDFNPYALLALLAAFGLGFRDLLNRRLPRDIRTLQLTTWGFGMIVLAGALLMPFGGPARMPSPLGFGLLGMVFVLSGLAYYAITASTRLADASVVAPFRYTRLLFALLLGAAVFGERPDAAMLLGAALIIGSGLYALVRGQRQGGA